MNEILRTIDASPPLSSNPNKKVFISGEKNTECLVWSGFLIENVNAIQ